MSKRIDEKYIPLKDMKRAEALWNDIYEADPEDTGRNIIHHLLTGSVLSIWKNIEEVYRLYAIKTGHDLTASRMFSIRVARANLNCSSRDVDSSSMTVCKEESRDAAPPAASPTSLIGVYIPRTRIDLVRKRLKTVQKERKNEVAKSAKGSETTVGPISSDSNSSSKFKAENKS